jgi:hypothetical protein
MDRCGSIGAGGSRPLQLVSQWKYGEGEREEEMEERRKVEREEEEETSLLSPSMKVVP